MKKIAQAFDFQKFQRNPKLAAITRDVESRYDKAALSDDDLELVSAAGETSMPTMNPDFLLGRHEIPTDDQECKP